MRRARSSGTPGEIALMAVITKAMGAFLILTIMLMPYYRSEPANAPLVDEMRERLDKAAEEMRQLLERSGGIDPAELAERLKTALADLEQARASVSDMKARLDQSSSMIKRLEAELAQARRERQEAQAAVASLQDELRKRDAAIASLGRENEALRREVDRLSKSDPSALQARIDDLEAMAAKVMAENAVLRNAIAETQAENANLKQRLADAQDEIGKRVPMPAVLTVTLSGCAQDVVDVSFLPAREDGDISAGLELTPWAEPSNQKFQKGRRMSQGGDGVPLENIVYFTPAAVVARGVDVYFHQVGPKEKYASRLAALRAGSAFARVEPGVIKGQVNAMVEIARRLSSSCSAAMGVSTIGSSAYSAVPTRLPAFTPVVYGGRLTLNEKGSVAGVAPDPERAAAFYDRLMQSFCETFEDSCDLARRITGVSAATLPSPPHPTPATDLSNSFDERPKR